MCDVLTDVLCDMMGCDVSCSVVMGCDVTWWDGMGWGGMCDVGQTSYVESLSTQLPVTMIIGPKSLKFPLWSFFGMWMFPCGSNPRCWYFWQSPPLDGSQFLQVNGTQSCPFNPMTLAALNRTFVVSAFETTVKTCNVLRVTGSPLQTSECSRSVYLLHRLGTQITLCLIGKDLFWEVENKKQIKNRATFTRSSSSACISTVSFWFNDYICTLRQPNIAMGNPPSFLVNTIFAILVFITG